MNSTSFKTQYLLLFRNTLWSRDLSAEETQNTISAWYAWFDRLVEKGNCKGGHPLGSQGTVVSKKGRTISDGPFAESKEAIGGYFLLEVEDLDQAVAIAKECPGLAHGVTVEVRAVMPNCCSREDATAGQRSSANALA